MVQKRKNLRKHIIKNFPLVIYTPALVCYLSYSPTFYFSYNIDIEIIFKKSTVVTFNPTLVPVLLIVTSPKMMPLRFTSKKFTVVILTPAHVSVLLIMTTPTMMPLKLTFKKSTVVTFTPTLVPVFLLLLLLK